MSQKLQIGFRVLMCAAVIALVDLILKSVAIHVWSYNPLLLIASQGNPYTPIGFIYTANTGIAFGIPISAGVSLFFTALIVGAALSYFYDHYKLLSLPGVFFSLVCITAGALSNTFDRLTKGFVIDYIQLGAFPVFNLGDAAITIGTFSLILSLSTVWKKPHPHNA